MLCTLAGTHSGLRCACIQAAVLLRRGAPGVAVQVHEAFPDARRHARGMGGGALPTALHTHSTHPHPEFPELAEGRDPCCLQVRQISQLYHECHLFASCEKVSIPLASMTLFSASCLCTTPPALSSRCRVAVGSAAALSMSLQRSSRLLIAGSGPQVLAQPHQPRPDGAQCSDRHQARPCVPPRHSSSLRAPATFARHNAPAHRCRRPVPCMACVV